MTLSRFWIVSFYISVRLLNMFIIRYKWDASCFDGKLWYWFHFLIMLCVLFCSFVYRRARSLFFDIGGGFLVHSLGLLVYLFFFLLLFRFIFIWLFLFIYIFLIILCWYMSSAPSLSELRPPIIHLCNGTFVMQLYVGDSIITILPRNPFFISNINMLVVGPFFNLYDNFSICYKRIDLSVTNT